MDYLAIYVALLGAVSLIVPTVTIAACLNARAFNPASVGAILGLLAADVPVLYLALRVLFY